MGRITTASAFGVVFYLGAGTPRRVVAHAQQLAAGLPFVFLVAVVVVLTILDL